MSAPPAPAPAPQHALHIQYTRTHLLCRSCWTINPHLPCRSCWTVYPHLPCRSCWTVYLHLTCRSCWTVYPHLPCRSCRTVYLHLTCRSCWTIISLLKHTLNTRASLHRHTLHTSYINNRVSQEFRFNSWSEKSCWKPLKFGRKRNGPNKCEKGFC